MTIKEDLEETNLVFVYGSLKEGYWNHHWLIDNPKFMGEALTVSKFTLRNNGFPYMLADSSESVLPVLGEVYRIKTPDTLINLDILEGVENLHYRRVKLNVVLNLPNGGERLVTCWGYVAHEMMGDLTSLPLCPIEHNEGNTYYIWKGED